jgi:DNA repair exonuclease SbcCD ATPase subunit
MENKSFLLKFKDRISGQTEKELNVQIEELKNKVPKEQRDLDNLYIEITSKNKELADINNQINIEATNLASIKKEITAARAELIETNENILLQSFGIYEPKYDFASSEMYKERLEEIRKEQKQMIKDGTAATGSLNWSVNNNAAQGKKMVQDMQKLLIRAFNSECDEAISKVKFNTYDTALKRISNSADAISKLGKIMNISISWKYRYLKEDELALAHEYQIKKQEEKEHQKALREEMREQAKLQKEIEEARKTIEKEAKHYKNALEKLLKQEADAKTEELKMHLQERKAEIMDQIDRLTAEQAQIDYRAANQKAGYVYIISNIGSFGENVYKIGMTRRLEPLDRVDELGDASVPFDFDVHAMIFTEDAPALEAALHKAFENRKINMVNYRREFFNVSIEEIEAVVKANYDKTVEFNRIADAEQYRVSQKIKAELNK